MKNWLKNPDAILWVFVIAVIAFLILPLTIVITDKTEERVVKLNGQSHSIFINWNTKRVHLPAMISCTLFEDGAIIYRIAYLPPARFIPGGMDITNYATPEETTLYRQLFPTKS